MFDPRNVLSFCPKEELKKVYSSLEFNREECNMCKIKEAVRNYNTRFTIDEDKSEDKVNEDNSNKSSDESDSSNNECDSNLESKEDSEGDSEEETGSRVDDSGEFIYTNGIQCDICVDCYETYPETKELKDAMIFYSMIYEHAHYYPCFPETERVLAQRDVNVKEMDVYGIEYKGCKYLDSLASYNTILECMDMFGMTLNECLTHFLASVENGKRESNLSTLGFGTGFPGAPLVIYKLLEKFIRNTVVRRLNYRPNEDKLKYPEREQEDNRWYNYDEEVKTYYKNVEIHKKLQEYPNNYKLCWREQWELQDIHLVNFMYEKCFFEDEKDTKDCFLGNFDYKASINKETKEILTKFLQKYADTYTQPTKEDYKYTSISGRSYNGDKCTYTYATRYIGDDYGGLDRVYSCVENENVFLYAIHRFVDSINIKDEVYAFLKKKYGLPTDILNHIDLMY